MALNDQVAIISRKHRDNNRLSYNTRKTRAIVCGDQLNVSKTCLIKRLCLLFNGLLVQDRKELLINKCIFNHSLMSILSGNTTSITEFCVYYLYSMYHCTRTLNVCIISRKYIYSYAYMKSTSRAVPQKRCSPPNFSWLGNFEEIHSSLEILAD